MRLLHLLEDSLKEDIYKRADKEQVKNCLTSLGVKPSDTFTAFYNIYEGPFWEEHVPFELLDITDIESYTLISRNEYNFHNQYLVLCEMSGNATLVLDTLTDYVYTVNFEGGDERLQKGELTPSWLTFHEFLRAYFNV
ncbi:SMI1/KNR4 family protein [Fictibacillus nanhaiensis]|uniref:SMI1/KNR4 family protein n=1 Tax=Fictibacillus nanhaiensis TaxID=742169 RepID=UPI003C1DB38D